MTSYEAFVRVTETGSFTKAAKAWAIPSQR